LKSACTAITLSNDRGYDDYKNKMADNYVSLADYTPLEIEEFLSREECNQLIRYVALDMPELKPSVLDGGGGSYVNENGRKSSSIFLPVSAYTDCPLIKNIYHRVADFAGYHVNQCELIQVVKYSPGGKFDPHYDLVKGSVTYDGARGEGPRVWTCLVYLNDCMDNPSDYEIAENEFDIVNTTRLKGGDTSFTTIGTDVKPRKGKLLMFKNIDDDGKIIKQSMHKGCLVEEGNKWIFTIWIRKNEIYQYA
jgi:prolyl 4-hydroxylase